MKNKITGNFDGKENALSDNKRRKFYMLICWKVPDKITVIAERIQEIQIFFSLITYLFFSENI